MHQRILVAAVAALGLSGCATAALKSYVGGPVDAVVARYGPPIDQYSLPNGDRALRWVFAASHRAAAAAPPDAFLPIAQAPLTRRRAAYSGGLLLGGMCVYTVLARPDANSGKLRVVGYRQPRLDCN